VNKKEAKNIINNRKGKGYKIFYIEWVFDRFHEGHKSFFKYIKRKATTLYGEDIKIVVGVESDRIVRKKKWKTRPYDNEYIRLKEVSWQEEVDLVFIVDRDIRFLIKDLKNLGVDYFIIPDEYFYNKIILKIFKKYILPKFKKSWIKVIFSRHKQYKRFGVDDKYINLHTTDLINKGWKKIIVKVKHAIYLIRESLIAILEK
jgi:glycerol-3-phosphate cytidylyltransferase-like family protein